MLGKHSSNEETSIEESHAVGKIAHNPEAGVVYDELHVPCPPHTTDRKLTSRIDAHLLPFIIVLYLLAFLDRVNIANAKVYGLVGDLGLTGNQYNTCLTIFFVPYVVFEIPSNLLLKRFSPRVWLSICCIGFGFVTTMQGLVQNYGGLIATRFLLGIFECGMFPGCFYLLAMWYKRAEAQKRFTLFFSSTSLAGAFGGLLASAIGKMSGMRGYLGWRWIFILEGTLTCLVGIIFLFTFPSFPEEAKWLAEDERAYIQARLRADSGHSGAEKKLTLKDALHVMKDYKIWLGGIMYLGMIVPAYGYAYFAPTIIKGYGFSATMTQLRSVPPWVASFGFGMIVAVASDASRHRFLYALVCIFIAIAGIAILMTVHDNIDLEYAALFLSCMGTYSAMPIMVCWFNMNLSGHRRRSVGSAWMVGFGNIGGIIATYSFLPGDAPYYRKGYIIALSFLCLGVVATCLYAAAIYSENKKKDKTVHDVGLTDYEKTELGDHAPNFRYLL
jgi:MFS family permease